MKTTRTRPTKRGRERERDLKIWPRDHVGLENLTSLLGTTRMSLPDGISFHGTALAGCTSMTDVQTYRPRYECFQQCRHAKSAVLSARLKPPPLHEGHGDRPAACRISHVGCSRQWTQRSRQRREHRGLLTSLAEQLSDY